MSKVIYHRCHTNLWHVMCRDDNIDNTTRTEHIESLITYDITDNTAYLSKSTKYYTYYLLSYCLFLFAINHVQIYNTTLFHAMMQFTFKPLMEVDWLKAYSIKIVVNVHYFHSVNTPYNWYQIPQTNNTINGKPIIP